MHTAYANQKITFNERTTSSYEFKLPKIGNFGELKCEQAFEVF